MCSYFSTFDVIIIRKGSIPFKIASFYRLERASAGYSSNQITELGTSFRMSIQTLKVNGSNLYNWLKFANINLSSGNP